VGERLRRSLPAVIGLALLAIAVSVLRRELHALTWHTLAADLRAMPASRLLVAAVLTAMNYAVLAGYDFIPFASIGRRLPPWRIARTSLLAYAIANSVGLGVLSGASVRYRYYSGWGLSAGDVSRITFSNAITFWLGLLALGGMSLMFGPLSSGHGVPGFGLTGPAGLIMIGTSAGYVLLTGVRDKPADFKGFALPLPTAKLAFVQLVVSVIDWILAAAVFYVLLPASGARFMFVLGAFLTAQLLGVASHVPGGVGVFEGMVVLLLKPFISSADLVPALVVYRAIYYLVPLSLAVAVLIGDEMRARRSRAARLSSILGRLTEQLTPRLLAVCTFAGGVVLLSSGATPAAGNRLAVLDRVVPLGLIETSHVLSSVAGAALLLLSQGLARRLDLAYYLATAAVTAGMVASLFKGLDYEEALILAVLLGLLRRARPAFDRRAAFFATRFSPTWVAAVLAGLAGSVWLGLFAFRHVEYSRDLWWQFELDAGAPRFLRGSVGAATVVVLFAFARLIGHAPHETAAPSDQDLLDASAAIEAQHATSPFLVYLRDKALLFDNDRQAFIMYRVKGRTWVALGDPVGPQDRVTPLIRSFLERCLDFGGTPVFYQVSQENLHHYADFGLTFVKLGEEAKVDLDRFSLEGSANSRFRQSLRRLQKDGLTFRVLPPADVPGVMEDLRAVSDDWLSRKVGGEKGFSMGFFEPEYLARFPVAVIEGAGRILAFANLWPGPEHEELSIDLMRYRHEAPPGVMEGFFSHLLLWGKQRGYRRFVLGMAPMSGFESSPVAPLWTRIGLLLYEHGEPLYHFRGLRAYKDKFHPVWESRYLAYPGGRRLPRILADTAALVAGGYRRIFIK
jgi:phosphatidylglycerol lysyltransferase